MYIRDYIKFYRKDINRISDICLGYGYYLNYDEIVSLWETFSNSRSSSWLELPASDEELWDLIAEEVMDIGVL